MTFLLILSIWGRQLASSPITISPMVGEVKILMGTDTLSLPSTQFPKLLKAMPDYDKNYQIMRYFILKTAPDKDIALVAPNELAIDAQWTPFYHEFLRIWLIRKATHLKLVKGGA